MAPFWYESRIQLREPWLPQGESRELARILTPNRRMDGQPVGWSSIVRVKPRASHRGRASLLETFNSLISRWPSVLLPSTAQACNFPTRNLRSASLQYSVLFYPCVIGRQAQRLTSEDDLACCPSRHGTLARTMQQRREEIIAKTAKLAELKRQRELRANQASAGRSSLGTAADVGYSFLALPGLRTAR